MTRVLSLVGRPFGVGKHVERGAATIDGQFLERFGGPKGKPWFAYVHAMEPHLPYEPFPEDAAAMGIPAGQAYEAPPHYNGILPFETTPEPPAGLVAKLIAQYDAEIHGFSRSFGALVDEMRRRGMLEDTIVVLVADHGEEFHEHGGWTHGHSLHRELLDVPLIVRLPDSLGDAAKASRGRKIGGTATLLDVMPTLLDLCGIRWTETGPRRSGASLAPQLLPPDGKTPSPVRERSILFELTMESVGIRSIREGRWQLVVSHHPQHGDAVALYDDGSDPQHRRNRLDDELTESGPLRQRMDADFSLLERVALTRGERVIDDETAERLKKIGYVGGK
jgi:arylsulfatase A-like enzyme